MGVIYKISNNINNKVYIGETIQDDPYKRWRGHQASKETKVGRCGISNCINGRTHTSGGFIWKFVESNPD